MWNKLPDEALITEYAKHQDPEIIGVLYERYLHLVFGVSLKYLKNREEARDAVMDIFESLFAYLENQTIRNFSTWLYKVSKNHCLMKLRSSKSLPLDQNYLDHAKIREIFVESDHDLHLYMERESNLNDLESALLSLHKNQEQCIRLFFLENKSYREVAQETGMNIKKVKSHIQNGKRNLKKILTENGKK